MNKQAKITNFLIRHGMSITMVIIIIGLVFMLQIVEIKNKTPVEIMHIDGKYVAYIMKNNNFNPMNHRTIHIDVSDRGNFSFEIRKIKEEPLFFFMEIIPVSSKQETDDFFNGNSRVSGFVFTNDIKLWSLVFSKWKL